MPMLGTLILVNKPANLNSSGVTLVEKAIAGNSAAIETLIEQQEPRIYALARAILRQPECAEDATQETCLRMVQQLKSGRTLPVAFETWILVVARNISLSILRRRRVRGEGEYDAGKELQNESPPSPIELVIKQEDIELVKKSIDSMPIHLREVLVLHYFHGLKLTEIAGILEMSAENARIRLWRALRELRNSVGET